MIADDLLLSTLDAVAKRGSHVRRSEVLKRITTLFVDGAARFSEQHIQLFDDVYGRLIAEIETKARFELSTTLAEMYNAPHAAIRQLANDDNISVARPVLQYSQRLEDADLLAVVERKSQQHLLAVSRRLTIAEIVSDVLVRRGDREVVRTIAGNTGARLSFGSFGNLVRKAEKDGILAEKVGQRADIPDPLLRALYLQATQVVQRRLFATATSETRDKIRRVIIDFSRAAAADSSRHAAVGDANAVDSADETALARLAGEGRYDDAIAVLARLCHISRENMSRIVGNKRADPELVACKALGFDWQTAEALILAKARGNGMSAQSLELKRRNFEKLSAAGAQDVMRLWQSIHDASRTLDA